MLVHVNSDNKCKEVERNRLWTELERRRSWRRCTSCGVWWSSIDTCILLFRSRMWSKVCLGCLLDVCDNTDLEQSLDQGFLSCGWPSFSIVLCSSYLSHVLFWEVLRILYLEQFWYWIILPGISFANDHMFKSLTPYDAILSITRYICQPMFEPIWNKRNNS